MVDKGQHAHETPQDEEADVDVTVDEDAGAPQTEVALPPLKPRAQKAAPEPEVGGFAGFMRKILGSKPQAQAPVPAPKAGTAKTSAPAKTGAGVAKTGAAHPPAPAKPIAGPLVSIVTRNEFYRDGFRNLIKIAVLQGIVIVGLILTLIVHINNSQPQDRYFATTADGRIMQLVPLGVPNLDDPALLSWVSNAVTETMSFTYLNYQKELQKSSQNFTKSGWASFTNALQKSRILDSVQAEQQIVTAQPRSAPVLLQKGVFNGKYRWLIKMPLAVTYRGEGHISRTDTLNLQLVVERVPSLENPSGVGIVQWIATTN